MPEENEQEKGVTRVSRRQFFKQAGVIVGGTAAGVALSSCGGESKPEVKPTAVPQPTAAAAVQQAPAQAPAAATGMLEPYLEPEETVIQTYCQASAVDVKKGRIVRMRPVPYGKDYPELKPWTITARGKTLTFPLKSPVGSYAIAMRKRTTSPNRILYPLKRVDWEPGGDPAKINAETRGKSKFVRISWDEATTLIASELKRVADKYGPSAICDLYLSGHNEGHRVEGSNDTIQPFLQYWALKTYGDVITERHRPVRSTAGGALGGRYVWGNEYEPDAGLLKDVSDNTDMLLCWGSNGESNSRYRSTGQINTYVMKWWGDLGIKRVYINPDMNLSAGTCADKWIPIETNTDAAFASAIAHVWLTEGTYEKDYLATHAVGYEKYFDYVLGKEDGVPKTPEWAAPITGVPEWTIKAVARNWAKKKTSIAYGANGGGVAGRSIYIHESIRMQNYLMAMQGWGAPGKHIVGGIPLPGPKKAPSVGSAAATTKINAAISTKFKKTFGVNDKDRPFIERGDLLNCFSGKQVNWWVESDPFYKRTYPFPGKSEVHLNWSTNIPFNGSVSYGFRKNKALRLPTLECSIHQGMYFEDSATMADIILPVANLQELDDIKSINDTVAVLALQKRPMAPVGEAKSDRAAIAEVAKKLGVYEDLADALGTPAMDTIKATYSKSGWQDLVSWEKLNEKGYFPQPLDPEWDKVQPESLAFFNDPKANPLRIPSGLIEFESTELKENFPDDKERAPVAHYVRGGPESEGWSHDEDRLISAKAKDYPLLMQSAIREWGHHSGQTDISLTREIIRVVGPDGYSYSPVWINPKDAESRGIKDKDIVRIFNDRGSVLGAARVIEKIIPGSVHMDKAGGADMIDPLSVNRGGSPNSIAPQSTASLHAYGLAPSGYLVQVEKVSGEMWDEWRKNFPDAFARKQEPAYGPFFEGWVVEGATT